MTDLAVTLRNIADVVKECDIPAAVEIGRYRTPWPDEFVTLSINPDLTYSVSGNYFTGYVGKLDSLTPEEAVELLAHPGKIEPKAVVDAFVERFSTYQAQQYKERTRQGLSDRLA